MLKHFYLDIKLNTKKYAYISSVFLLGFFIGMFILYFSKPDNLSYVSNLMGGLFLLFENGTFSSFEIVSKTFLSHLKTLGLFLFARATGASLFIVTIICVMSGYATGYSFCALFTVYGIKALFIILFAIIPPKLFTLSGYALLFSTSLDNQNTVYDRTRFGKKHRFSLYHGLGGNFAISYALIMAGILADAFFAPAMLRLFAGMFS